MQRRTFITNTALCAVAVSASGFIRFDGNRFVGDCETTSDILGPFYRPDSPVRNSLVVKGENNLRTAMAKTVGLPLGIAAKLILNGTITTRGLHIPIVKDIYEPVLKELELYDIKFNEERI